MRLCGWSSRMARVLIPTRTASTLPDTVSESNETFDLQLTGITGPAFLAVDPSGRSRFGVTAGRPSEEFAPRPPLVAGVASGAIIGLLAGLTGTGGGIFLTPLMIAAGWAGTRHAAGTSAIFILANSVSGLAGNIGAVGNIPAAIPLWLGVVAVGGLIGSERGSRRLPTPWVRRGLAVVLVVAGLKLIFLP